MVRALLSAVMICAASAAAADGDYCVKLYDSLQSHATGDMSKCEPVLKEQRPFKQCVTPFLSDSRREASHLIMILDASGSMAGKIGGETKMKVAQREATRFLNELPDDVPVGLMVYGHEGDNTDAGKATSCSGIDWAHKIGKRRSAIKDSIDTLSPTGWTPMGAALEFATAEFANLKPNKKVPEGSAPVVFLISDGEETCGGDPIAAAEELHASGVKASLNVIGFDVDRETRAQLEAISKAGGGRYFAADDAAALRKHLKSQQDALHSEALYQHCINGNENKALTVYHETLTQMPGCWKRESDTKTAQAIVNASKALTDPADVACADKIFLMAHRDDSARFKVMKEEYDALRDEQTKAAEAAIKWSIENAIPHERSQ